MYRIFIGTEVDEVGPLKDIFASIFAGFTYYKAIGGWHEDGAPYAGGGSGSKYMEENAHVFEIVCSPDYDFNLAIAKLAPVLENVAEQIMVTSNQINTHHFSVSEVLEKINAASPEARNPKRTGLVAL